MKLLIIVSKNFKQRKIAFWWDKSRIIVGEDIYEAELDEIKFKRSGGDKKFG